MSLTIEVNKIDHLPTVQLSAGIHVDATINHVRLGKEKPQSRPWFWVESHLP